MAFLFRKNPRIVNREKSKELVLNSKSIFNQLVKYGFPIGVIPKFILKNKNYAFAFLRGLFDTDGNIFWDKRSIYKDPYPRITINTTSKVLCLRICALLENMGFKVALRSQTRDPHKTLYYIELYGFKNLKKWKTLISSSNIRKFKKLSPGSSVG